MGEGGKHIVLSTNGEDTTVALAVEPPFDGDVVNTHVKSRLRGELIAIELYRHVRYLTIDNGIVQIAFDAEIVRLAHRIAVDVLIEADVHIVFCDIGQSTTLRVW